MFLIQTIIRLRRQLTSGRDSSALLLPLEKQNELSQRHSGGEGKEGGSDRGNNQSEGEEDRNQKGKKPKGFIQKIGCKRTLLIVGAIILLIVVFLGVRYWIYASSHETTDDAYTAGHTHQISPRITGTIDKVLVDDNWYVKAGQPLVQLDPSDYQVSLQRAQAHGRADRSELGRCARDGHAPATPWKR